MPGRDYRVNEQIRTREVRIIGENGEQIGVMPTFQALQMARDKELDLVEVAPNSVPPVCRFMDYGKFHFEQEKKEREAKKAQKSTGLREVRVRPSIAQHDRDSKLRHVKELLEEHNKVKLAVMFRGREMQHPERGLELLKNLTEALKEDGKIETPPMMEGRYMSLILAPVSVKKEPGKAGSTEESAREQKPEGAKT
ncbi:MAG: translation initiation factor IF-3 [Dehalococcoidia bacterium]|nr:translation initiation factor IF-3 [Dehalococcoidia bacterium]